VAAEPEKGRAAAIDRAAQLAAVLKGLGYKGIHIGGVHRRFDWAGGLLDRMAGYESQWQDIASRISFPAPGRFRAFPAGADSPAFGHGLQALSLMEKLRFHFLRRSHDLLFNRGNLLGPLFHKLCALADGTWIEKFVLEAVEEPVKRFLLNCQRCGDCGIQRDCPKMPAGSLQDKSRGGYRVNAFGGLTWPCRQER
jgi:methylenetetrahydrofolate reductase (NADPH)